MSKDVGKSIRIMTAKRGIGLSLLVNDPDWEVRKAVAEQNHELDKLAKDKDFRVSSAAIKQLSKRD